MRCFFIHRGHIVAVEMLPDLTDDEAIEKGHALFKARKDPLDGFEIWERERVVFQHPAPAEQEDADDPPPSNGPT